MTSALAQKRSHVLPQDVSTVLDFLAQDIQELHALEKKSSTREGNRGWGIRSRVLFFKSFLDCACERKNCVLDISKRN